MHQETNSRDLHSHAFRLHSDLETLSSQCLERIPVRLDSRSQVFFAAQLARALNYFKAVRILSSADLAGPAAAVLRTLLEMKFVTRAISLKPEQIADLINNHEHSRGRAMKYLGQVAPEHRSDRATDEEINAIKATIDPTGAEINVREWAKRARLEEEYLTAYCMLSSEVHASLLATESHLQVATDGQVIGITPSRGSEEHVVHLVSACDFMAGILRSLPTVWLDGNAKDLEAIEQRLFTFME